MHARGVEPDEERLAVRLGLVDEGHRLGEDLVIDGFHSLRAQLSRVLDLLLPDLAPARHHGGVVHVRGPGMDHVPRAHRGLERGRVVAMARVLHRVEVIEVAEELVEAVHRGQELVQIAQVVLPELAGRVAHGLERCGDGRRLRGHADRRAGLADGGHPRADWQLAGDEVRPPRRAARLGVVVGEAHPLGREPVEVGCPPPHDALVVGADIEPADVVTHDHDDIGLLLGRCRAGGPGEREQEHPYRRYGFPHVVLRSSSGVGFPGAA